MSVVILTGSARINIYGFQTGFFSPLFFIILFYYRVAFGMTFFFFKKTKTFHPNVEKLFNTRKFIVLVLHDGENTNVHNMCTIMRAKLQFSNDVYEIKYKYWRGMQGKCGY